MPVTTDVRGALAVRWHPRLATHGPDAVGRLWEGSGVAALANAYEGFSTCLPAGSTAVLDGFAEGWVGAPGTPREQLLRAFAAAQARFAAGSFPTDDPEEVPAGVLLAAAFDGPVAHVAWIGGDVAVLVRAGAVVGRTAPHTLAERLRRERPEVPPDRLPNVLGRTFGARGSPEPSTAAFTVEPGDVLLLLARAPGRGPCVPPEEAAALTATLERGRLASELAERGLAPGDAPYAAVAAFWREGPP